MASFSSLIQELRERIAAASSPSAPSSSSAAAYGEDPLVLKSRVVLPSLLHTYVIPSSSANEREVIAIVKLVSFTAQNFPAVFFNGSAAAALPVIGRFLPFLADPAFRARQGVVVDAISSLLSLLRTEDREAYRQFFLDATDAIQDIFCVASMHTEEQNAAPPDRILIRCFSESFVRISNSPVTFCELPTSCRPTKGPGLLVDLTSKPRWRTFSTSMVRLVSKCLTEGTVHVKGLVSLPFVSAACSLLCYGDAALYVACFDFACIIATVIDAGILPAEYIIRSIACILGQDTENADFRDAAFDSSMGFCFHILHSSCLDHVVVFTASDIVEALLRSVQNTESSELQVALCSAYKRIIKLCPSHIWKPEILVEMLFMPKPCSLMIECIQAAVDSFGPEYFDMVDNNDTHLVACEEFDSPKIGQKRTFQQKENMFSKRQRMMETSLCSINQLIHAIFKQGRERESADSLQQALVLLVGYLKPGDNTYPMLMETAIEALSLLCIAFSAYPAINLTSQIFQQVLSWLPWICKQAKERGSLPFDLCLYFEAIQSILLFQRIQDKNCFLGVDNTNFIYPTHIDLINLLKLLWDDDSLGTLACSVWKVKCLSLQVLSKVGCALNFKSDLELLDLAIHDESEEVRNEALISFPIIVLFSGPCLLGDMIRRLESVGGSKPGKSFIFSLAFLCCLNGSCSIMERQDRSPCKLFLGNLYGRQIKTLDLLLGGFWCPQCNVTSLHNEEQASNVVNLPVLQNIKIDTSADFTKLLSLFFQLLYEETSEELMVSCVQILPRFLRHASREVLLDTKIKWAECIDFLLLHKAKTVREAFADEINCFLEGPVWDVLFLDELVDCKSREEIFLDKIKHAIAGAGDPYILLTVLESAAEIMKASDIHGKLFLYLFILLIDQLDNHNKIVRMTSLRLIQTSCYFCFKGGFELIFFQCLHIRDALSDFMCGRLVSHPAMIRKFAEAVVGISTEEFIQRMVPFIIPKLIVSYKNSDQVIEILHELANHMSTRAHDLVIQWSPQVLAFALFNEDGQELTNVLQFFHSMTGSDSKEICAASIPALLDELLCFPGEAEQDEKDPRTGRIPMMMQEVARIMTGSDDLPVFLKNHFVGLLNSIDKKMLRADDVKLQKQALHRLKKLMEMMGAYLGTHVPKIMVLLMYAIEREALQTDGLNVLHLFINHLAERSPSSLKHVMSQVVAAFIPSLERSEACPSVHLMKIVEILEDLIIKNYLLLNQHIRELPLLPGFPVLTAVNKAIQEARGLVTLQDQLQDAANGLNHESLNVRYMVACELSKLLNSKREDVTAMISGEGTADLDVISSLITALLRGCAEESRTIVSQKFKIVCADCLGALGAVDPAKLKGISSERFKIKCSDDDLIFELIHKHLARAFRAASDTMVQDAAALAIQELLKLAGCQASVDENADGNIGDQSEVKMRGQRLWDRFSNYVREIIAPCLTSKFLLSSVSDAATAGPIYRPAMSFRRWIYFWTRKLTAHATGSRFSIFSACRGIVRHDMPTAIYLLPYLVLNAVCHGTPEARHSISEEILSVLDAAASENSGATINGVNGGQSEVCVQAVFTLLDNLGQWVDDLKQEIALCQPNTAVSKPITKGKGDSVSIEEQLLVQCSNVAELLAAIPKVTLAKASFRCQAHARALMYFEPHVREKSGSFNPAAESSGMFSDEDISFLMEIYSGLDVPDGLMGLANLRKSSSLQDQLLINEKSGNWAEVLTFCEQALQMEPDSVQRHSDVLNCLLNMCHLQAMITHVDGLICRIPQYKKTWCMQGVQAAWRLGKWDLMDEFLSGADGEGLTCSASEGNASFDFSLAKILQAMRKKDQFMVDERIVQSKQALLAPLAAAGMDSYMRAYPYVVKLHMLCELEDFNTLLAGESFLEKSFSLDDLKFSKVMKDWESRLRFTQPSLWAREPLLAFRRLVYGLSSMHARVGNCWLQYAKLCRSAGHYETAHHAILEAHASGAPNVHMERAKYLWGIRKSDRAIAELQQTLLNMPVEVLGASVISSLSSLSLALPNAPLAATQASQENLDVAKTVLLYTRWSHHTGQKQKEDIICLYSRVRELQPNWEKGYFFMAKYCDDLLVDARKRQEDVLAMKSTYAVASASSCSTGSLNLSTEEKPWWSFLPDVLLFYAKGLHKGHKNLFQALPRLLTLWFEFGSIYHRDGLSSNKLMKTVHTRVMGIMRGCLKDLPTYQWLTVLSQLISRICHQNEEVVRIVKHIITSVLQEYTQQALWMMAAVSKSTVAARRDAAAEIMQAARRGSRHGSDRNALFVQFASLIDHLIKLCFHPGQPKARTINISTEFSALKRMMPLGIILPVQQALTVTLPSYDTSVTELPRFHIFSSSEHATISGIGDEAEILSSLQRPKKVIFLGSDGVARPFLCKPKDDLRKDSRMMEFNAMINRLLSKIPESRRRKLYIRTFAVIPLTEDCGMIEWVPHTQGLRHILQNIYVTCGKFDRQKSHPLIKRIYDQCQGKMPEDEMLKTKILPLFPPVFHKWFLTTFSEPAAWFRARLAYAHTAAVWSMVGHIVGLGDRHGENILFDSTSGDCVHVDFSCLFDKGLMLDKPELVPFRLTQNMIDGLGITGYEGVFLKVCEITLSVLRTHKETLMSVLEAFIHDPLVEWTKSHKSSGVEVQNPHAQRAISNSKGRLEGIVVGVAAAPSLPLSVEGQARRLIAEAVSHKNLGKMYIWWMPWF